jgi:hypothetical protein
MPNQIARCSTAHHGDFRFTLFVGTFFCSLHVECAIDLVNISHEPACVITVAGSETRA